MNLTSAEAKMLGRRAQQPVKAEGELLAVFVSGKLRNPLNGLKHWRAEYRYRLNWKTAVAQVLFEAGLGGPQRTLDMIPLRIRFLGLTHNTMDDDNLPAAIKPVRDALIECGVIASDAPGSGHTFEYAQRIDRARRGIEVRVSLR